MSYHALIIVDMLNDFIDEKGALYGGPESRAIIPRIRERLETFRKQGDLVVFMQDSHTEDDPEFQRFPKHCVTGSWGGRVIPELEPGPNEPVLPKKTLSTFYRTDLEKTLTGAGVREVDVVGVCTSICVMDTVGGLSYRGYTIRVPEKEVADFDIEMHRFALVRMGKTYGAKIL